jgi:hypothetical protein
MKMWGLSYYAERILLGYLGIAMMIGFLAGF